MKNTEIVLNNYLIHRKGPGKNKYKKQIDI